MTDVSPEESFDFSSGSSSDKEKFCWTSSNSCFMLLGFFSLFFFNTIPFWHSVVAGVLFPQQPPALQPLPFR